MNELDQNHLAIRDKSREYITSLVSGAVVAPLVAEVVHINGESDSEEIS